MVRGFPDWRPPSAPGSFDLAVVDLAAPGDVIASPGAGFRIVLYGILISNRGAGAAGPLFQEVTPANVAVRRVFQPAVAVSAFVDFDYLGLPFAETNKLRRTDVNPTLFTIHVTYRIETV